MLAGNVKKIKNACAEITSTSSAGMERGHQDEKQFQIVTSCGENEHVLSKFFH
jgi:hypothetical protein